MLAALVGQIAPAARSARGFIVSSLWLFALTARGFGERIGPKLLGIGVVLSFAVYLFFTKALSLALPAGRSSGCWAEHSRWKSSSRCCTG